MGPDGVINPTPAPLTSEAEPLSLCQLGPCRHFHELAIRIDAAKPLDGSQGSDYVHTIRTCYPSPGIEMDLAAPVRRCNRWAPMVRNDDEYEGARARYTGTMIGQEEMAEFEASWLPEPKQEK